MKLRVWAGSFLLSVGFFVLGGAPSANAQVAKQKTKQQLLSDLANINRSIDATREKIRTVQDARFLPDIYFVLAELLGDKSRYLQQIKRLDNKNVPDEELDFTNERRPKQQAIEAYQQILDKFPTLRERDKAMFYMAHEYRELGQQEEMVKIYSKLTKDYPDSRYWAEAQVILGNHFFENKKDFEFALEIFRKVIEKPPGPFHPLARYKIGWIYINLAKFREALLSFEDVLSKDSKVDLSELPDIYKKTDVRRDALLAMVWPYSELTLEELSKMGGANRNETLTYFFNLANNKISYQKVLRALGRRLSVKQRYVMATRVYFELLRISHDLEDKIEAAEKVYESMRNARNRWPVNGYVDELAETVHRIKTDLAMKPQDRKKVLTNFEIFARDVATRFQERAKETKQKEDYRLATHAYQIYLSAFGDSPKAEAIRLNLAETLFNLKSWVEAGKRYEDVAKRTPDVAKKRPYFDSALEAYTEALKVPASLTRVDLTQARNGLRDVGAAFIKLYSDDKAVPSVRFNIGRTYYDERNFDMAVKAFNVYVARHPNHTDSRLAVDLILDSFNQKEDYKGLAQAGKRLLKNARLGGETQKEIQEIVRQAEYRGMQAKADDFTSRDYTQNLLKFAQKYKGSNLGDQALYEAFVNYRSKRDPQAYDLGEQLLQQHGNSKYAKEVVSSMGQMAMNTADFRRAARFFEAFVEKYPKEPESNSLLRNAANMREYMGDFDEAAKNFRLLNDSTAVARMDYLAGRWASLETSGRSAGGIRANYWQGLAKYRRGDVTNAKPFFSLAANQRTSGFEDKSMAAHALYLLSAEALKNYKSVQMVAGQEAKAIQTKDKMLKQLSEQLNKVIRFGNGRWAIAALYGLGQANTEFAEFILKAPVPAGLTADQVNQFKTILLKQSEPYSKAAQGYFDQCVKSAEKFEVFSRYVKGCQSLGQVSVNEAEETRVIAKAGAGNPRGADEIRQKLYDAPRDVTLLKALARSYSEGRDYAMAQLILNRLSEIEPRLASAKSMQGMNYLFMNDLDRARQLFQEALKIDSKDPTGLWGMASLYREFKYEKRAKEFLSKAQRAGKPESPLHEWVKSLL